MAELPRPVSRVLRPPLDDVGARRVWSAIEERRSRSRAPSARSWLAGGAVAAIACAAILAAWRPWESRPIVGARIDDGPLRTASGETLPALALAHGTSVRTIRLSDGSTLRLSKGARARVLESSGRAFVTVLEAGRLDVHVHPGGPRRWIIECGAASVAVVGTRFSVERDEARVAVAVVEGVVEVTPAHAGDAHVRLGAGESLVVPFDSAARAIDRPAPEPIGTPPIPSAPSDDPGPSVVPTPVRSAPRAPRPPVDDAPQLPATTATTPPPDEPSPAPTVDWQSLLADGDARGAWAALSSAERGRIVSSGSAEELMRLADAARLSGHPADAARALDALLARYPGHGSAPIAAFTLGRLALDRLGNAARAATAFERALSLGIGRGLREDAMARLVEAHARAGNTSAARAAATRYRASFPEGRRRAIVDRWSPAAAP